MMNIINYCGNCKNYNGGMCKKYNNVEIRKSRMLSEMVINKNCDSKMMFLNNEEVLLLNMFLDKLTINDIKIDTPKERTYSAVYFYIGEKRFAIWKETDDTYRFITNKKRYFVSKFIEGEKRVFNKIESLFNLILKKTIEESFKDENILDLI